MKKLTLIAVFLLSSNWTYASVIVVNGLTHIYNGVSGTQIKGEVVLLNNSNVDQTIHFSLNDAIFSCTENRIFSNSITHKNSSLSWFDGSLIDKTLSPKEKFTYQFVINVPNDATIRGTYWSMLMLDIDNPIRKEKIGNNIGLNTKIRYAIGLLTNVNTYTEVNIDFQKVDLKKDTSTKKLEIKINNLNQYVEGIKLSLEVYDANGKKIFESATLRNMVFPGFCKDYSIDLSTLENGQYECLLVADTREKFVGTNISLLID